MRFARAALRILAARTLGFWTYSPAFWLLAASAAWAQNGTSEIVVPPAPPIAAAPAAPVPAPAPPLAPPPPGLVQTPLPPLDQGLPGMPVAAPPPAPAGTAASAPAGSAPQLPPPADTAPVPPDNWTPGTTATLGVLNKVDGSISQLSLPAGGKPVQTGDLLVSVQACLTRPAGQIPDAAIFVTVMPANDGTAPLYRGWLVRSDPGATVAGDAGQTFRVINCV